MHFPHHVFTMLPRNWYSPRIIPLPSVPTNRNPLKIEKIFMWLGPRNHNSNSKIISLTLLHSFGIGVSGLSPNCVYYGVEKIFYITFNIWIKNFEFSAQTASSWSKFELRILKVSKMRVNFQNLWQEFWNCVKSE